MKLEHCCFEVSVLFSHLYFVKHEELEVSYFVLEIFLCVIFFLSGTSVISQPLDHGQDFTVMDWINEANKRKRQLKTLFKKYLSRLSLSFVHSRLQNHGDKTT